MTESIANGSIGASQAEADPPRRRDDPPAVSTQAGSLEVVILVDASNVAHGTAGSASTPKIDNLNRVLTELHRYPVRVVTLADATLRHKIDRKDELEAMFDSGTLLQVPAGTQADDFLWLLWHQHRSRGVKAFILTNDRFPYTNAQAESIVGSPRVTFLFAGSELLFQPTIDQLLADGGRLTPYPPFKPISSSGELGGATTSTLSGTEKASAASSALPHPSSDSPTPNRGERVSPLSTPTVVNQVNSASKGKILGRVLDLAIQVIAACTEQPGGQIRRVNFATIGYKLHQQVGGDFVQKFGLAQAKDIATELAAWGLVEITHTNTTLYVEPTAEFDKLARARALPRLQGSASHESPPTAPSPVAAGSPALRAGLAANDDLPDVLEVSSREHGPSVEIPAIDVFVDLMRANRPRHVFHWWSRIKDELLWKREGEFFFTLDGTTYRLAGKGYRTLTDYQDGRARGLKGADSPKLIGDPKHWQDRPRAWKEILSFHELDEREDRPSEGDVYYFIRMRGFQDFSSFLASEKSKPDPVSYY